MIGGYIFFMWALYGVYPIIKNNPPPALASSDAVLPYALIDISFVLAAVVITVFWFGTWAILSFFGD